MKSEGSKKGRSGVRTNEREEGKKKGTWERVKEGYITEKGTKEERRNEMRSEGKCDGRKEGWSEGRKEGRS